MAHDRNDTFMLLCKLSKATSLQVMADISYDILGNPVFIQDRAHITLAHTRKIEIEDEQWKEDIVNGYRSIMPTLKQNKEVGKAYEKSIESGMPVIVNDTNLPYSRMVKALLVRGLHVASIILTAYCKPIEEEDVNLMEIISSFIRVQIQSEKYYLTTNEYTIENFLLRLLNGEYLNAKSFKEHARILNWSQKKFNYMLTASPISNEPKEVSSLQNLINQFRKLPNCHYALFYDGCILCIFGFEQSISNWEKEVPEIAQLLKNLNLIAGVSQSFQSLKQLNHHYHQSHYMMEISFLRKKDLFLSYDENAIYHLLRLLPKGINPKQFCHKKILTLKDYDERNHTELIATLQMYLENQKSITRTSKLMFLHRNTVSYRINKCMDIMNTLLENSNEVFSFIFSLRILEYYDKQL